MGKRKRLRAWHGQRIIVIYKQLYRRARILHLDFSHVAQQAGCYPTSPAGPASTIGHGHHSGFS